MSKSYLLSRDFAMADKQLPGQRHGRDGILEIFNKHIPAFVSFHEKQASKCKKQLLFPILGVVIFTLVMYWLPIPSGDRDKPEGQRQEQQISDGSPTGDLAQGLRHADPGTSSMNKAIVIAFYAMCAALGIITAIQWRLHYTLATHYSDLLTMIQDMPKDDQESDEMFEVFESSGLIIPTAESSEGDSHAN